MQHKTFQKFQNFWKVERRLILLLGLLFLSSCSQSFKKEKGEDSASYDFASVKSKIQYWIKQEYYPGASIIIARDNQVIYEEYFGNYSAETVVYIASAGKWLAAATIAAVVEEGNLSWDDKVEKWLPEFNDIKGQATLRQLLSHTSGYPDYQPQGNHPDNYQTLEEAVKHIKDLPADTTPGAAFHYGGLAMQVAGRMAELAVNKVFEEIFQEKIALPLGMKTTHFTPVDTTQGHNPMIGGGARCTLHDYANFLEMILNDGIYRGNRILAKSSIAAMETDQVKNAAVYAGEYVENARALNHKSIYGFGQWREMINEKGEAVLISSPGWAGAYPWIDKEMNAYGFFLSHVNVALAAKNNFSSFYASPELAMMVREIFRSDNQLNPNLK